MGKLSNSFQGLTIFLKHKIIVYFILSLLRYLINMSLKFCIGMYIAHGEERRSQRQKGKGSGIYVKGSKGGKKG